MRSVSACAGSACVFSTPGSPTQRGAHTDSARPASAPPQSACPERPSCWEAGHAPWSHGVLLACPPSPRNEGRGRPPPRSQISPHDYARHPWRTVDAEPDLNLALLEAVRGRAARQRAHAQRHAQRGHSRRRRLRARRHLGQRGARQRRRARHLRPVVHRPARALHSLPSAPSHTLPSGQRARIQVHHPRCHQSTGTRTAAARPCPAQRSNRGGAALCVHVHSRASHLVHKDGARQAPAPGQPRRVDGHVLAHHHHLHLRAPRTVRRYTLAHRLPDLGATAASPMCSQTGAGKRAAP